MGLLGVIHKHKPTSKIPTASSHASSSRIRPLAGMMAMQKAAPTSLHSSIGLRFPSPALENSFQALKKCVLEHLNIFEKSEKELKKTKKENDTLSSKLEKTRKRNRSLIKQNKDLNGKIGQLLVKEKRITFVFGICTLVAAFLTGFLSSLL